MKRTLIIMGILFGLTFSIPQIALTAPGDFISMWGSYGAGNGQFFLPYDMAIGQEGKIFVADTYNGRIQAFDGNWNIIAGWSINYPKSVDIGPNGYVYVIEHCCNILIFDEAGNYISGWGGRGAENGQLGGPYDMAIGSDGNIYVADYLNDRVQVFDAVGNFIAKWGSSGTGDGQFIAPWSIAVDKNRNIYVGDVGNSRIQVFDSAGNFKTKWGISGSGDGQFAAQFYIAADKSGEKIYISDTWNHRVQVFDTNGNFVTKWGDFGYGEGQLYNPMGISVDSSGYVYVADTVNNRIQIFEGFITAEAIETVIQDLLVSGEVDDSAASVLTSTIETAQNAVNNIVQDGILTGFIHQVDAMTRSGKISPEAAEKLKGAAISIINNN